MNPLSCTVKQPQFLSIGETVFHSGCAVIEVLFPNYGNVNIGKIMFVNNYTAFLNIKIKVQEKTSEGHKSFKWKTLLNKHQLMKNPHCETGSQDYYTLLPADFKCKPHNVCAMRFILFQPSPNWKTFSLEEIYVFQKPNSRSEASSAVPHWLKSPRDELCIGSSKNDPKPSDEARLCGLPDPEDLSLHLQQMWMLTDKVEDSTPNVRLGRFDVDGCYEINLLSYS